MVGDGTRHLPVYMIGVRPTFATPEALSTKTSDRGTTLTEFIWRFNPQIRHKQL